MVAVARVLPVRTAAVEIVRASPTGAAWTALAEMTTASAARADGHAAFGEEFPQAFHGAAHALLRGVIGRAERGADFAEGFVLKVTEQHGGTIGFVERGHGFVEQRFNVRPIVGGGVHGIHLGGDLFAQLAAGFAADDINGGAAGDLIQPRAKDQRASGAVGFVSFVALRARSVKTDWATSSASCGERTCRSAAE